jgi:hypothetical protein
MMTISPWEKGLCQLCTLVLLVYVWKAFFFKNKSKQLIYELSFGKYYQAGSLQAVYLCGKAHLCIPNTWHSVFYFFSMCYEGFDFINYTSKKEMGGTGQGGCALQLAQQLRLTHSGGGVLLAADANKLKVGFDGSSVFVVEPEKSDWNGFDVLPLVVEARLVPNDKLGGASEEPPNLKPMPV